MGADAQLPMTGGSEYITESQLPSHSHPYYGPYFAQTNRLTGGPTFMTYMGRQLNASDAITNGSPDQATEVIGSGQAYYPKYIQTYMWTKVLYYDSIIYSASGDAMGTFADVLGSLYPVGAQIYRTSAISAHPSDATKVQPFPTEAPLQQWQLVDNGSNIVPLEYLSQDCTSTSFCGRADMTPATARQDLTTAFLPITGSIVENFTPVLGTKKIKYAFQFMYRDKDANPMAGFRIEVKEGNGSFTEVTESHISFYDGLANINPLFMTEISWTFVLDDVDDSTVGSFAAERPVLGFRVTGREVASHVEAAVHENARYITDTSGSSSSPRFRTPTLEIVSMGPETQAITYQRTA